MQPEDKLQRSSALARNQSQNQKANKYKQILSPNATIIGYNADLGANVIQLPDGSINYAQSDTNGVTAIGEGVPLHMGTNRIDGLPNIKKQLATEQKKVIETTYEIKILFSTKTLLNDGTYRFDLFIGGDRASPIKVAEINSIDGNERAIFPIIQNRGKKTNQWSIFAALTDITNSQFFNFTSSDTVTVNIGGELETQLGVFCVGYNNWKIYLAAPNGNTIVYFTTLSSGQINSFSSDKILDYYTELSGSLYSRQRWIVDSTKTQLIVRDSFFENPTRYEHFLITDNGTFKINSDAPNLFSDVEDFQFGNTWINDSIYYVSLSDELKTKTTGILELRVFSFKIKYETDNTVTLIKTSFLAKVNALKNLPPLAIIWNASYAP